MCTDIWNVRTDRGQSSSRSLAGTPQMKKKKKILSALYTVFMQGALDNRFSHCTRKGMSQNQKIHAILRKLHTFFGC